MHMIGSLISVQFCPRRVTEQQTSCQKRLPSFAKELTRELLTKESTFFSEHMSSQQVKRGEARPSEVTDASTDGGPGSIQALVRKHVAQSTATGSESV